MFKIIRMEWEKVKRDKFLWGALVVFAIITIINISLRFRLVPSYTLDKATQFYTDMTMSRGERAFSALMIDLNFTILLVSPLVNIMLGRDFINRSMEQYILVGYSRVKIFIIKIIECYLIVGLAVLIRLVVGCLMYSMPWVNALNGIEITYTLQSIGLKIIADMSCIGIGLMITFALRDFIRPVIITLIFWFVMSQMQMIRIDANEHVGVIIFLQVMIIIGTTLISYLFFRKAELR